MKTIKDIEEMKNHKTKMFENAYNMLLMTLEDYHISKVDGAERIKQELNNWDDEAKQIILADLSRGRMGI